MFISKKFIPRRTFSAGCRSHAGLAAARFDGARTDPVGKDGCRPGPAVPGNLASARRSARILEPAAGRAKLRVLIHHQASGAVPQSRDLHLRNGHAGGDGQRRKNRVAITRAARFFCPPPGRAETR